MSMSRCLSIGFVALVTLLPATSDVLLASPAPNPGSTAKPLSGYSVIRVEKFGVSTLASKSGFPQNFENEMQKLVVEKLTASKLFENVVDASEASAASLPGGAVAAEKPVNGLILSATVIGFDPGNQAARSLIAAGAGAAKVQVHFAFRDAGSNEELLRSDLQGKYDGNWSLSGSTTEKATQQCMRNVVKELIKEIQKNR
jgi:Domain of unknown function (DUF4410)